MSGPLRWAILGGGRIAHAVAPKLAAAKGNQVLCAASRDKARARGVANAAGLAPTDATTICAYDDIITRPDVDAVYITLMNHEHFAWAKRCLEAGKHVLCEKPLVATANEAQELADAAAKAGRICCEGFMHFHHLQTHRLVELAQGAHLPDSPIGPIRTIRSARDVTNNDQYILNTRLSHTMQGGSVMDVGCYPISTALLVAGEEPIIESVRAMAEFAPKRPGEQGRVDETCEFSWRFPSGATFEGRCSFNRPQAVYFEVVGEWGRAYTDYPFSPSPDRQPLVIESRGVVREEVFENSGDKFIRQFEHFAQAVAGNAAPLPTMEWSITEARTIEAIHRAIGLSW